MDDQFAFSPNRVHNRALITLLHTMTSMLTKSRYVRIIALDFSKAFDTVRHRTLLHKLSTISIPDEVYNNRFVTFDNRSHCAKVCDNVVSANCVIEVLTVPAVPMKPGYVKLNGVVVWNSTFVDNVPHRRGVNILLIDPFNCSLQESRNFDILSNSGAEATRLSNYLQQVSDGSVVVGVSNDEATRNLDNALSTLQQLGANVSDVRFRGSYAFVAQKGYPAKTVLRKVLTEAETAVNPAALQAVIAGILHDVTANHYRQGFRGITFGKIQTDPNQIWQKFNGTTIFEI